MQIRNVRTYALEFNGHVVPPKGTLDVPDDLGRALCEQPDNWAAVKKSTEKET